MKQQKTDLHATLIVFQCVNGNGTPCYVSYNNGRVSDVLC